MSAIRDGHVPVRVATWGLGRRFARFLPALVRMRAEGQVELVGATAAQLPPGAAVEGIPVLPREELVQQDFDLLLLMVADAEPLVQEVAERWGVPRAKVASSDLLRFPGLDLRRWLQLRQTPPSIVAADAWGARACQSLQIPCRSPFQGALVRDADFLRLAADLPGHLAQPLELDYVRVDDAGRAYPVMRLGSVQLHFRGHDPAEVPALQETWAAQMEGFTWENVLLVLPTASRESAEAFAALEVPWRKLCLVPFASELTCAVQVPMSWNVRQFASAALGSAGPEGPFDLVRLLLGEQEFQRQTYEEE